MSGGGVGVVPDVIGMVTIGPSKIGPSSPIAGSSTIGPSKIGPSSSVGIVSDRHVQDRIVLGEQVIELFDRGSRWLRLPVAFGDVEGVDLAAEAEQREQAAGAEQGAESGGNAETPHGRDGWNGEWYMGFSVFRGGPHGVCRTAHHGAP